MDEEPKLLSWNSSKTRDFTFAFVLCFATAQTEWSISICHYGGRWDISSGLSHPAGINCRDNSKRHENLIVRYCWPFYDPAVILNSRQNFWNITYGQFENKFTNIKHIGLFFSLLPVPISSLKLLKFLHFTNSQLYILWIQFQSWFLEKASSKVNPGSKSKTWPKITI